MLKKNIEFFYLVCEVLWEVSIKVNEVTNILEYAQHRIQEPEQVVNKNKINASIVPREKEKMCYARWDSWRIKLQKLTTK